MVKLRTSDDAFADYLKLKEREEKLVKNNKGFNLLGNFNAKKPRGFYISLMTRTSLNLKETNKEIEVSSNIPLDFNCWRRSSDVQEFLEKLNEYCKAPIYKYPRQRNRKIDNKMSMWNMPKFRNKKILFEDIKITIGEKAYGMLYSDKLDFVGQVRKILESQKEITAEEKTDFDNYFLLCERIKDLERNLNPQRRSGYFYNNSNNDKTLTMSISKQEYNERLEVLEAELKIICDKHEVLKMPSIDYKEIIKAQSPEEFEVENKQELEEVWSEMDDEDKEEFDGDFNELIKTKYTDYLEYTDFD